jgi:hypothetical protein
MLKSWKTASMTMRHGSFSRASYRDFKRDGTILHLRRDSWFVAYWLVIYLFSQTVAIM